MTTDRLYTVTKNDFPKLEALLTECFRDDPLYRTLIPDPKLREKLLPALFKCDLEEFAHSCEIYADSAELNGLIIVSDEDEPYNAVRFWFDQVMAELKTDGYLLLEDPSLMLIRNFTKGREYLSSEWTDELNCDKRIHIIYLAVSPSMRHHGITDRLLGAVTEYADAHGLMLSLETHNPANVDMYRHFGYGVYRIIERIPGLCQYCMVRYPKSASAVPQ